MFDQMKQLLQRCETRFHDIAAKHSIPGFEDELEAKLHTFFAQEIRELLASVGEQDEWRQLHASLQEVERKITTMAEDLTNLASAEQGLGAKVAEAIDDIKALGDKLAAIPTSDPTTQAAIDALAADMNAKTAALTAAMATPAPTPTPTPTPTPVDPAPAPTTDPNAPAA